MLSFTIGNNISPHNKDCQVSKKTCEIFLQPAIMIKIFEFFHRLNFLFISKSFRNNLKEYRIEPLKKKGLQIANLKVLILDINEKNFVEKSFWVIKELKTKNSKEYSQI